MQIDTALLASALVFAAVSLAAGAFALGYAGRSRQVTARLEKFVARKRDRLPRGEELRRSIVERLAGPVAEKLVALVNRRTPREAKENLRRRLAQAGYLGGGRMQVADFMALRVLLVVVIPGAALLLLGGQSLAVWMAAVLSGRAAGLAPGAAGADVVAGLKTALVTAGVLAALGYLGPELFLRRAVEKRQRLIRKQLPDALDLLTVCVEAGLGFDAALAKVVEKMKGPLPEEFARTLQEVRLGKPRRDALRDFGKRVGVEEVSTFVAALVQADQLGVSIGKVLRLQSEQTRQKRRQRAEEQAMKAPIKMLFPLVFFIFPALFVVLLGPAVIQIFQTFATLGR